MPGYRAGEAPVTKYRRYPPHPLEITEIVALLDACKPWRDGRNAQLAALRLRALIVLLWRSGLRISEALALEDRDLVRRDFAITVRHGKGDKRRVVAMDTWGWDELERWLTVRRELPYGAIFCVLTGPTAGMAIGGSDVRRQLRELAKRAGLRRRVNPHAFRGTLAVETWREGINLHTLQQQLGHKRLDVTQLYLRGIAPVELLEPIGHRRAPMMPIPPV